MKQKQFIIFFTIVTLLYNLLNAYVLLRITQSLELNSKATFAVTMLLILLANFFFPSRRVLHALYEAPLRILRSFAAPLLRMLARASAVYLGFFSFALLLLLFSDFIIIVSSFTGIIPGLLFHSVFSKMLTGTALLAAITLTALSVYFAHATRVKKLHYKASGAFNTSGSLCIVVVSDIHLGTVYAEGAMMKLARLINRQQADLVLFAGDVLDENPELVLHDGSDKIFLTIQSTYGMYAVTGNHEYFGGIDASMAFFKKAGITVLIDECISCAGILLVGRDDRSGAAMKKIHRKPLSDYAVIKDTAMPVIVLDHQPQNLDEAADANITAQFSGHTHHAQLFPFSLITNLMYEKSWGYLKKKNTHFYISCGYGTWGPPLRLGSHSEIVVLQLDW